MLKSLQIGLLGLGGILASISVPQLVLSQPACSTFYNHYNLEGKSFEQCTSGDIPNNWNDRVSSLAVPSGYKVHLYQDYGYGGRIIGPYFQGEYNVPGSFNDQLSSVSIEIVPDD
jgi:hypothetical protein